MHLLANPTYRYHEPFSPVVRTHLTRAEKCVHCRRGGARCLNRSLRLINFAVECEAEAKARGAFMIGRLARALFDLARHSREWEPEHFAIIKTLCGSIRHIGAKAEVEDATVTPTIGFSANGDEVEEVLEDVVAWVSWLEDVCRDLRSRPSSTECLRRPQSTRSTRRHCS